MGEKTDEGSGTIKSWGSSLSLGLGLMNQTSSMKEKESLIQKNPSSPIVPNKKSTGNNDVFHLPPDVRRVADRGSKTTSLVRGVDVNLAAPPPPSSPAVNRDVENGVSSPNSTVSSISGKRSERETTTGDENDAERASYSLGSDDEDGGGGDGDGDGSGGETSRKKLRLSKEQSLVLEETFKKHHTLNTQQKQALAKQLNLRARQVEVWFQNRRARTKLKQNEADCEYLRRCCELLTTENRRMQKEVQELRALKLSPQMYMHMNPPTTLTMCPSCERVAVSSTSSSSATNGPSMAAPPNRTAPSGPIIHRPVPINFWATNSGRAGPFDSSISRP